LESVSKKNLELRNIRGLANPISMPVFEYFRLKETPNKNFNEAVSIFSKIQNTDFSSSDSQILSILLSKDETSTVYLSG